MSYKDRLRCLDLHSLELRRLHLDLLYCYKIVFGLVDVDFSNFTKTRLEGMQRRAKLQSNHHHQQTDAHLFAGWMPFLSAQTDSVKALKGNSPDFGHSKF